MVVPWLVGQEFGCCFSLYITPVLPHYEDGASKPCVELLVCVKITNSAETRAAMLTLAEFCQVNAVGLVH